MRRMSTVRILTGDCRERLVELPDESVHCCVTSPPYYGLRDYGVDGQLGLEETPEQYVHGLVDVFREVRRVLRDDGTLWLNIGDSYARDGGAVTAPGATARAGNTLANVDTREAARATHLGLKPKDLIGIPWRVAFALQADGWWLRSDIIWHKPNPMPESVRDRPTSAHEHVFLLAKSERYYYDHEAVKEPDSGQDHDRRHVLEGQPSLAPPGQSAHKGLRTVAGRNGQGRNRRNVWTIATKPYSEAHFAVYPPDLIEPCIKAGTSEHGCCPECGAPWERVVERATENRSNAAKAGTTIDGKGHPSSQVRGNHDVRNGPTAVVTTTGWAPTCDHEAEPTPCTVLDPFGGAGTTGLVADRLGRDAILIELNPEYAAMAERRVRGDAPLFVQVEVS